MDSKDLYNILQIAKHLANHHVSMVYKSNGKISDFTITQKVSGLENATTSMSHLLRKLPLQKIYYEKNIQGIFNRMIQQDDVLSILPRGRGKFQTLFDYYKMKHRNYLIQYQCYFSKLRCAMKLVKLHA